MANSDLRQKEYIIPSNIIKTLEYKKDSDVEGNKRINNWLETGIATYEQLKKFKNDIETKYNKSEWQDILRWLNSLLNRERGSIYRGKKIKSDIGLDNMFRKSHFKDSNGINAIKIPKLMEDKKVIKLNESDLINLIESRIKLNENITSDKYDFQRENYDGPITSLYIEYENKPTKATVIKDLEYIKNRYREGSEFNTFAPKIVTVYPFIYGWTRGWKAHFSIDENGINKNFYDEPRGEYTREGRYSFYLK